MRAIADGQLIVAILPKVTSSIYRPRSPSAGSLVFSGHFLSCIPWYRHRLGFAMLR